MKPLVVFSFLFFIVFLMFPAKAWWDANYDYRRIITVTSPSILTTNSTINITFDHASLVSNAKSLANGDDIRIIYTNSTGDFDLDRQNVTNWNTANTELRVKVQDGFSAGQTRTNYTLYYGYPSAINPPNNNVSVFMYAYDFNSALGAEWATWNGICDHDQGTITNSWVRIADMGDGNGYNCGLQNTKGNFASGETFIKIRVANASNLPPYDYGYFRFLGGSYYYKTNVISYPDDSSDSDYAFNTNLDNTIATWIFAHNSTYNVKMVHNGTSSSTSLPALATPINSNLCLGLGTDTYERLVSLDVDWLFASDFSSEPIVTLSTETEPTTTTTTTSTTTTTEETTTTTIPTECGEGCETLNQQYGFLDCATCLEDLGDCQNVCGERGICGDINFCVEIPDGVDDWSCGCCCLPTTTTTTIPEIFGNSSYPVGCCPISKIFCVDNQTLEQMWNISSWDNGTVFNISTAFVNCPYGCDTTLNECRQSPIQEYGIYFIIIIGVIIAIGIALWLLKRF